MQLNLIVRFFLSLILIGAPLVSAEENRSAAEALADQLRQVGALRASFSQLVYDSDNTVVDESSGWVAWQQPDQFRWEVLAPWEQSLLIDGKNYYQYDRDLEQLLIQPLSKEISVLPKLLLSGNAETIQQSFVVSRVPGDAASSDQVAYELLPADKEALFERVAIWFQSQVLVKLEVVDEMGQVSQFSFADLNPDIVLPDADSLFVLEPEPDTDVIYQ